MSPSSVANAASAEASSAPKTISRITVTTSDSTMRPAVPPFSRDFCQALAPRPSHGIARNAASGSASAPTITARTEWPPATASEPQATAPSTQNTYSQPASRKVPTASRASASTAQPIRIRRSPRVSGFGPNRAACQIAPAMTRPTSSQPTAGRLSGSAMAVARPPMSAAVQAAGPPA